MMSAQENQVALPLRSHTILGVCEAIGEDFGFNPVFLRVPFAATVSTLATFFGKSSRDARTARPSAK
jgi:phage shock protein PspC (stress-responsive transcriptional regulator)